jgi:hypothetical protein
MYHDNARVYTMSGPLHWPVNCSIDYQACPFLSRVPHLRASGLTTGDVSLSLKIK